MPFFLANCFFLLHPPFIRALKYLLKFSSLVSGLSSLIHSHSIAPLLSVLLFSLLSHHFDYLHESSSAALELMLSLLDEVALEGDLVYHFTRYIHAYIIHVDSDHNRRHFGEDNLHLECDNYALLIYIIFKIWYVQVLYCMLIS